MCAQVKKKSLKIPIILQHKFCVEGTNGKHVSCWCEVVEAYDHVVQNAQDYWFFV